MAKLIKAFMVDPEKKSISAVDVRSDLIATFLGSESVAIFTLPNGDLLYIDPDQEKSLSDPFKIDGVGQFYGKAIYASAHMDGRLRDVDPESSEILSSICFHEDPIIEWFKRLLKNDGIEINHMIEREDGKLISTQSILSSIAVFPEGIKNELRMIAMIDNSKGINTMNLIAHIANAMEVNHA